jgi:CMP-N,N'-diacetyllegionaminic acid synthase
MTGISVIITARGGSKGIPRKNIRMVCGKPLIAYSIEAALHCSLVERCYVTTEDEEIKAVSRQWGAAIIDRPAELATDTALSSAAVAHALLFLKESGTLPKYFALLQPTSPLRTADHLLNCLESFLESKMECGVSVTKAEHHPWKMLIVGKEGLKPVYDRASLESPRQSLPDAYRINGAIYCMSSELFLLTKSFYVEPAYTYEMPHWASLDIDSEFDLQIMEMILTARSAETKKKK